MTRFGRPSSLALLVFLAACSSKEGLGTDPRPLLADLCDPTECDDPAPLSPNYECPDGSLAGPACVEEEDGAAGCHWRVLECEIDQEECTAEECGPAPGAPNYLCEDGTVAGPSCGQREDGSCGWTMIDCPPIDGGGGDGCVCADPAPGAPNYLCEDGQTIGGPACVTREDGDCSWQIIDCPMM